MPRSKVPKETAQETFKKIINKCLDKEVIRVVKAKKIDYELIKLFLDQIKEKFSSSDLRDNTILDILSHSAAMGNRESVNVIKFLLPHLATKKNQKLINASFRNALSSTDTYKVFLPYLSKDDLNEPDSVTNTRPFTMLMEKFQLFTEDHIKTLIEHGVEINYKEIRFCNENIAASNCDKKYSPIMYAIYKNKPRVVKLLLENGAEITRDELNQVRRNKNQEIVKMVEDFLEKRNKDIKQINIKHKIPKELDKEIISYLGGKQKRKQKK